MNNYAKVFALLLLLATSTLAQANKQYAKVPGKTEAQVSVLPSGAVDYTIPLALPIGTNGVMPRISLKYNSMASNGLVGRGWSITGMGSITRCAASIPIDGYAKGVAYDSSDKFCLNGSRLVLVKGEYGKAGSEYRTEINGNQKVVAQGYRNGAPRSFEVKTPDGRSFVYGGSDESRVELQRQSIVHTWALSKNMDLLGNYIEFNYHENNESGEFYPSEILYTGNTAKQLAPYNSVEFVYGNRQDPEYSCVGGSMSQTSVRLQQVRINKHVPTAADGAEGQSQIFRRYILEYERAGQDPVEPISNDACLLVEDPGSQPPTDYQLLLDSRFESDNLKLDRIGRYQEGIRTIAAPGKDGEDMSMRDLLEVGVATDADRDALYETLLKKRDERETHFRSLYQQTLDEYNALSAEEKERYREDLFHSTNVQAGQLLFSNRAIVESAKEAAQTALENQLREQLAEASRIILLPQRSREKEDLYFSLLDKLRVKFRGAKKAADECLNEADKWQAAGVAGAPPVDFAPGRACLSYSYEQAFEKFLKYGTGGTLYFDLFSDLSDLKLHVLESGENHFHHLLAAGQVVKIYEQFAHLLLNETRDSWDQDLAIIDRERREALAKEGGSVFEPSSEAQARRIDAQFKLDLLESSDSAAFLETFIGSFGSSFTELYAASTGANFELNDVKDTATRAAKVFAGLEIITSHARQEAYVNYQGILDNLLNGGSSSQLASTLDQAGSSLLDESRLMSVMECGSDASCFTPISFKWSEEKFGWSATGENQGVPDVLISHGQVLASNAGLVIDAGATGGSNDSGNNSESDITPTQKEIDLGRALAKAGQLVDVNGDGRGDWILAYKSDDGSEYRGTWLNTGAGWEYSAEYTLPAVVNNQSGTPFGQFIDINNDGSLDWLGAVQLTDGTQVTNTLLNTPSGWVTSPEFQFPVPLFVENIDGFLNLGELFSNATGTPIWVGTKDITKAAETAITQVNGAWAEQLHDAPFNTAQNDGPSGIQVDIDNDGQSDWFAFDKNTADEYALEAWLYKAGQWTRTASLDIDAGLHGNRGQFVDLNGDNLKDWVLSTVSATGDALQSTQINSGANWQTDPSYLVPTMVDAAGNQVAYLADIDGDKKVEWVQAYIDANNQQRIATQRYENNAWVASASEQLPFPVADFEDPSKVRDRGEFANISGDNLADWLNQYSVWNESTTNPAVDTESLVLASGVWEKNSDYRLPVLDARWLRQVSDTLERIANSASGATTDNMVAQAAADASAATPAVSAAPTSETISAQLGENSNGSLQSGHLVDVNGDGRADWVKSVRFAAGVQQKVTWLREDNGWAQSSTFVPPLPLNDFVNPTTTKLIDFDRDGLVDFLNSYRNDGKDHHEFWRNTGQSWEKSESFSLPIALISIDAANKVTVNGVLADINSDGLSDIVVGANGASSYLNANGSWVASTSFVLPMPLAISIEGKDFPSGQLVDANGDGFLDWLQYHSGADKVYLNNGDGWATTPSFSLPISLLAENRDVQAALVDLNSDGLKDVALAYKSETGREVINSWLYTGAGWRPSAKHALPRVMFFHGKGKGASLVDVNSDGKLDFVQSIQDELAQSKTFWLGTSVGWREFADKEYLPVLMADLDESGTFKHNYVLADVDGDNQIDFLPSGTDSADAGIYFGVKSIAGVIENIYDGSKRSEVTYEKGYKPFTVVNNPDERTQYPLITSTGPSVVVGGFRSLMAESLAQGDEEQLLSDVAYSYGNYAFDLERQSSAGFKWSKSTDWSQERVSVTNFRQAFPFAGRPNKVEQNVLWGENLGTTHYDYDGLVDDGTKWSEQASTASWLTAPKRNKYVIPYLEKTVSVNNKQDGKLLNTITTSYTPDAYGITKEVNEVLEEGGQQYSTKTAYALKPDISKWLLNKFSSQTVTKSNTVDNKPMSLVTTQTYNNKGLMATTTTSGLKTRYVYDDFGNALEVIKGEGSNVTPRSERNTYSAKGRFRTQVTNSLGEITRYEYKGLSDSASKITVNDGVWSEYLFDGFGRKRREESSNSVIHPFVIQFCNEPASSSQIKSCPAGARYLTAQLDNEPEGSAPETVYYDRVGREVRRATANAKSLVFIDTEYTFKGQIKRRTIPYNPEKDDERLWVDFEYDSFGRVTYLEQPGVRIKTWEYDGRKTTLVDERGAATATINTHFDAPAEIIDAYGASTKYIYNAFGQLVETIDAQNNRSSVSYDTLGNKKAIVDPDHGRTKFTYDIFGNILSKTDALGNREAYQYDEFGRRKKRTDTGFDSKGLAVAAVTTTWEYYDLNEAKVAYQDYLQELKDKEASEEVLEQVNEIAYLNPNAASTLVKEIASSSGYVSKATYDYRARSVSEEVTLPAAQGGDTRKMQTSYLGESSLPYLVTYPNNFAVRYEYDELGYLKEVKNAGLNTYEHYLELLERAQYLSEDVAPAVWAKAEDIRNGPLKAHLAVYDSKIGYAAKAEAEAFKWAKAAESAVGRAYDAGAAVRHLTGVLGSVTSAGSRGARDSVLTGLYQKYYVDLRDGTLPGCQNGKPRNYKIEVPAYEVTVLDRNGNEVKETRGGLHNDVYMELPTVCTESWQTGYRHLKKEHHRKERKLVDHIIGMMTKLRERSRGSQANVAAFQAKSVKASNDAKRLYGHAKDYYNANVAKHAGWVSSLNQAGNDIAVQASETYAKAARVYQFYEIESEISFWKINESDEVNRILSQTYGNGVTSEKSYNPLTGSLQSISTKNANDEFYQLEEYLYDAAGNLHSRQNRALGTYDTFSYDRLNRLTKANYSFVSNEQKVTQSFEYDKIGNIMAKSDVGNYTYSASHPHAVVKAGERAYEYDKAGRMIKGDSSILEYTTFSKTSLITDENGDQVEFKYGPNKERFYQKRTSGSTSTENFYFFKGLYEETKVDGQISHNVSISAGGKNIAVINGFNHSFSQADDVPEIGDKEEIANQVYANARHGRALLGEIFSPFNNTLNSISLIANTSAEDLVKKRDLGECIDHANGLKLTLPDTPIYTTGDGVDQEGSSEEPPAEPVDDGDRTVINCLTAEQYEEIKSVYASSILNINYFHYDNLDSVKVVTNGAGELVSINHYDAFGSLIIEPPKPEEGSEAAEAGADAEESNAGFGGHEAIVGTELVHMNGRVYDPVIGRFLSADPFVPAFGNPQAMNRYAYVYNNPLRYVDPSGYKPVTASQHERNEYIFVSLSYFFLEVTLPSEHHLYDLLALSRNDPDTFAQHITAWGSSTDAWKEALPFIEGGINSRDTAKQIRKAEREAKYLSVAAVIITVVTYGSTSGWLASWWASPALNAGAQLAITGDIDLESAALSFATSYVGSAAFSGSDGLLAGSKLTAGQQDIIQLIARGTLRGFGSHLAGGEFEHGFAAGILEGVLETNFPDLGEGIGKIIRSGIIEGLVTEVANETRNGEKLNFFDGFQLGVLREASNQLIQNSLNGGRQYFCLTQGCDFSAWGDVLNLVIEDGDKYAIVNALASAVAVIIKTENQLGAYLRDDKNRIKYDRADRFVDQGASVEAAALLFEPNQELIDAIASGNSERVDNVIADILTEAGIPRGAEGIVKLASLLGLDVGDGDLSVSNVLAAANQIQNNVDLYQGLLADTPIGLAIADISSLLNSGAVVLFESKGPDGNSSGIRLRDGSAIEWVAIDSSGEVTVLAEVLEVAPGVTQFTLNSNDPTQINSFDLSIFPPGIRDQVEALLAVEHTHPDLLLSNASSNGDKIRVLVDASGDNSGAILIGRKTLDGQVVYYSIEDGKTSYHEPGSDVASEHAHLVYLTELKEQRQEEAGLSNREQQALDEYDALAQQAIDEYKDEYERGEVTEEEVAQRLQAIYRGALLNAACESATCSGLAIPISEQESIREEYERVIRGASRDLVKRGQAAAETGIAVLSAFDPSDPVNVATTLITGGAGTAVKIYRNSRRSGVGIDDAANLIDESNAFGVIDRFRRGKGGLDELGDTIPIRGDGRGTVAFVDVGGRPIFGVNSSVLIRDADKELGRSWSRHLGLGRGKDQVFWHAEGHSLMRAYKKTNGQLPSRLTMFVDRSSCANCRTYLPRLAEEMGITTLKLHFKNGRSGQISNGKFEWFE